MSDEIIHAGAIIDGDGAWTMTRLDVGDTAFVKLPHSEVMMHMGVAGWPMKVKLLPHGAAQLYTDEDQRFSAPVSHGEAGIYKDAQGFYTYTKEGA